MLFPASAGARTGATAGGNARPPPRPQGSPLGIAAAGANRHDAPLLAPTLQAAISQLGGLLPGQHTCHLDAAYDGEPASQALVDLVFDGQIARLGIRTPPG